MKFLYSILNYFLFFRSENKTSENKTYEQLSKKEKVEAIIDSAQYLIKEFPEFFTEEEIGLIEDYYKFKPIAERIVKNKKVPLSKVALENIVDEARQYGYDFGY